MSTLDVLATTRWLYHSSSSPRHSSRSIKLTALAGLQFRPLKPLETLKQLEMLPQISVTLLVQSPSPLTSHKPSCLFKGHQPMTSSLNSTNLRIIWRQQRRSSFVIIQYKYIYSILYLGGTQQLIEYVPTSPPCTIHHHNLVKEIHIHNLPTKATTPLRFHFEDLTGPPKCFD